MMNIKPIITDIDDQDIYKKYMQNFLINEGLGDQIVEYTFYLRGDTKFTEGFDKLLEEQIQHMSKLRWEEKHLSHLKSKCSFFPKSYFRFLETEFYNPKEVTVTQKEDKIDIKIKGPIKSAINWEVPLMAVISQLNNITKNIEGDSIAERYATYKTKYTGFKELGIKVAEFGTRRRASFQIQKESLFYLRTMAPDCLAGTSNIALGRMFDIDLKGTIAHEVYMFYAAMFGLENANEMVTDAWWKAYGEHVDTMLPDTFTSMFFINTVKTKHFEKYRKIRQDSMEPKEFTDLFVKIYKALGINPKDKFITYSDNINSLEKLGDIHNYAKKFVNDNYGIGTWLSNDCGCEKINMVIKLSAVWKGTTRIPCAKLSDINGKITGDKATAYEYVEIIEKDYKNN